MKSSTSEAKIPKNGVCIITLSDNFDHQENTYSMFNELFPNYNVYSIGLTNPKSTNAPHSKNNFYFDGPRTPGITKKTFQLGILKKICNKIKTLNVKYVYFESEHIWNLFIIKRLKKKFIFVSSIHDVVPHKDSKGKKIANYFLCHNSDYVFVRSVEFREKISQIYHIRKEKVFFLPLWRFYPPKKCVSFSKTFLFFGRIRKYKGIDSLIKIISDCKDLYFLVVGKSDNECKDDVKILQEKPNVQVIDREVSGIEMATFFSSSICVILPYSSATQSGVIVDSYKFGKPVIAFSVGGIKEQIINGETGFLIPNLRIDLFEKALYKISSMTENEYDKIMNSSYDFGYRKYSSNKVKEAFINFFYKDGFRKN